MSSRGIKLVSDISMVQLENEKKDIMSDGAMAAADTMFKETEMKARSLNVSDGLIDHMK